MDNFDVFEPYYIPRLTELLENYGKDSIKRIHEYFNWNYVCSQEHDLLFKMINMKDNMFKVENQAPHIFWSRFLFEDIWTDCSRHLIVSLLSIPGFIEF